MNALELYQLVITTPSTKIGPLSLAVEAGSWYTLAGPFHSGKSLLMAAIAGLDKSPVRGKINIAGARADARGVGYRRVAYLCSDPLLFPHMTVWQNIAYGLKFHNVHLDEIKLQIESIASLLSLTNQLDKYPSALTREDAYRTSLARSIVVEPALVLLDDPYANMPSYQRFRLYDEIFKLQPGFEFTVFMATGRIKDALRHSDKIGLLMNGSVSVEGTPSELMTKKYNYDIMDFLEREY